MLNLRLVALVCMPLALTVPARADLGTIQALFRSILVERDDSRLPDERSVGLELAGNIGSLTAEEIQSLLPLAEQCLTSERPARQAFGAVFFASVAGRMDGSQLVAPYIDEIAPFLNDSREPFRNSAIFILGGAGPKPLPKGIAYLAAHFGDKTDTPEQTDLIAGSLLSAAPGADTVHKVLTIFRQRPDLQPMKGRLIEVFGIVKATSDEALAFVREGFTDGNSGVRMAAVEAVSKMPKGIRNGFAAELQRMISGPDETPELRDRARLALIQ